MVVAKEDNSQQPRKVEPDEVQSLSTNNNITHQSKSTYDEKNDEEPIEVDEFGRMLRRNGRQRNDDLDHSDHSDYERHRSEHRRYSSGTRSSRYRPSDDYYEPRSSNYHYRKLQYDSYVPRRSSYYRHSDSDREDYYRSDEDRYRDRKRVRTWSRRSSDSEDDNDRRPSGRRRSHSRDRSIGPEGRKWSQSGQEDPFSTASKYIDTEFYTRKIYVGELRDVSERALHNAFERFGDIESIDMLPEKGIAFIDFDTEENANEARRRMNNTLLGSGYVQVNRAKRPERNKNGFGNVPWSDADGAEARLNETKPITYMFNTTSSFSAQKVLPVTPAPPPQAFDPRLQGHKRKIIAYDDL
ncbi:13219_t:CDS:2 [Cetraspora pellucida]|uniref:13219_t:CDS:1 n=1 Tax=Cetraspora pellucida TaxID=1433469 RepID=A0ACA9M6L7_9GLOM|nr:13219_t:CDS:2 [Cetraspora pellucida]